MMDESKRTPRAVIWSAVLHVGLAAFLLMTTLSCTTWEHVFAALNLPASWNPITCSRPEALQGPVIEATLVGVSAAPLPPVKVKASKPAAPPPKPSPPELSKVQPKVPPVKTLPAPLVHPDTRDEEKVVARADTKAEQAKRVKQEREKQRMSELEAQQQQARLDKIFKQLDQTRQARVDVEKSNRLEQQKLAQLKDLKNVQKQAPAQPEGVKSAEKAQSGGNGTAVDAYKSAIQNAVTQAWLRPDNIREGTVCPIHIVQIPGGQVVSVTIGATCPFDEAGRRSVKNAVLRAQPLPYKGFESVFRSDITLNFKVTH